MALCPALWVGLSRRRRVGRRTVDCGGRQGGSVVPRWTAAGIARDWRAEARALALGGGVAAGVQTPSGRGGMRSHGRPLCTGPSPGGGGPDSDSRVAST